MTNTNDTLPDQQPALVDELHRAMRLRRLNPLWAKLEILLGLTAAVAGIILLRDRGAADLLCGALIVLGLYLAAAGHRSHLYQSGNRQLAYLVQLLRDRHK